MKYTNRLATLLGVLLLAICGVALIAHIVVSPSKPSDVRTMTADTPPDPATTPSPTGPTLPASTASEAQLGVTISYGQGTAVFQPASQDSLQEFVLNSSQAVDAFRSVGVYGASVAGHTPQIQAALFTGPPGYKDVPVWMVRYTNIPDRAAGPVGSPANRLAVNHDIVAVVDAKTGVVLSVLSSLPDR